MSAYSLSSKVLLAFLLGLFVASTNALTCFEQDDDGELYAVTNSSWKYCVLIPQNGETPAGHFGLGPGGAEHIDHYNAAFAMNQESPNYRILAMCIFERNDYNMHRGRRMNAHHFGIPAEFVFRCVCNYDGCNQPKTFKHFLKDLEADNAY